MATEGLQSASINATIDGDNILVTGEAGKLIKIWAIFFVLSAAADIKFKDGAATDFTGIMKMTANGSLSLDFVEFPWFVCSSGNDFILNSDVVVGGIQIGGRVYYTQS